MKNIHQPENNILVEPPGRADTKLHFGYGHCATSYTKSKQRSNACSQAVIERLMNTHGVMLDSIIDFGVGDGYWSNAIASMGRARQRVVGVDVSKEMLEKSHGKLIALHTEFVHGSVEELAELTLEGIETIFVAMTAHLMPFPHGISELVNLARQRSIRHVVVLEEVSPFYSALAGNPGFTDSLPRLLGEIISAYIGLRYQLGVAPIISLREAPFPTPAIPLALWRMLGLNVRDYRFDVPNITWNWRYSATDLVEDIGRRAFSILFCHSAKSAKQIADSLAKDFSSNTEFAVKHDIPFWYQLHIFKTV